MDQYFDKEQFAANIVCLLVLVKGRDIKAEQHICHTDCLPPSYDPWSPCHPPRSFHSIKPIPHSKATSLYRPPRRRMRIAQQNLLLLRQASLLKRSSFLACCCASTCARRCASRSLLRSRNSLRRCFSIH